MSLFKERLKELVISILWILVFIVIAGLIIWGLYSLPHIVQLILAWILYGSFALGFIIAGALKVWKFIKWLFIEPFRKVK